MTVELSDLFDAGLQLDQSGYFTGDRYGSLIIAIAKVVVSSRHVHR